MYSQYGEDEFLFNYFNKRDGFLVDIGAADGVRYSNSYKFISAGWSGLLIEPNQKSFQKLTSVHKNNEKVILYNCGASYETKLNTEVYCDKNDSFEQLTTFSTQQVQNCKDYFKCDFYSQTIDIHKTSEIFQKFNITKIDFLSIDTESYDFNVIKGIDFDVVDIHIIIVEHNSDELESYLKSKNYEIFHKTAGNHLYKKI